MAREIKTVRANELEKDDIIKKIGKFKFEPGWYSDGLYVNEVRKVNDITHITTNTGEIMALSAGWNIIVHREVKPMARYYFKSHPSQLAELVGPQSQLYKNASVIIEEGTGRVVKSS